MSEVRLVVRDWERDASGTCHGSDADRLVAALGAEPETIDELEAALERFQKQDWPFFKHFRNHIDDEPWDAGLVVIDLAARLLVCESSYSSPGDQGHVSYHDGQCATDTWLSYHLPEDWRFRRDVNGWQAEAEDRRRQRSTHPPLDARAILFGRPLVEFLAAESLKAFQSSAEEFAAIAAERNEKRRKIDSGEIELEHPWEYPGTTPREHDVFREIHARWLLEPREDLRGKAPRDVLLAKQEFISWDLQDRSEQWTQMGACPRGLDPQSHAYKFAAFGRHEIVKYYDLVRDLLACCWSRLLELADDPRPHARPQLLSRGDFLTDEVPRLEVWRDAWLDTPDHECHGLTPREVIDHERARIPEGLSGKQAMIDHDCPLCQMMADMPGPMFWGLDGCNMDDEFAFSFHRTREEWDKEQREHEEFSRRWKERETERERLGVKYPGEGYADPDYAWQRSFVIGDQEGAELPLEIRLFSLGSLLAELIVDLKSPNEERELIDALNRDWGNLRDVCQNAEAGAALIEPVLDRFCETLDRVWTTREELDEKCMDLQGRLERFLEPPSEMDDADDDSPLDDIPF